MSECRSCHAPMTWARTTARKNMPLDPEPTADGNVRQVGWDGPLRLVVVIGGLELAAAHAAGEALYTSHFATCEYANEHRRKK